MECIKANKTEFVFSPAEGEETINAFVFDFKAIPDKPLPRRVFFLSRRSRRIKFGMTGVAFGKEIVFVGKGRWPERVVLVRKEKLNRFRRGVVQPLSKTV